MSHWQQQRVAIARALVGARRLVLVNEPTDALDSEAGDRVTPVATGATPVALDDDSVVAATVHEPDLREPITAGRAIPTAGRAPTSADEVAVSEAFLDRGYAIATRSRSARTVRDDCASPASSRIRPTCTASSLLHCRARC